MSAKMVRQYGLWTSPIQPRGLAEQRRLESAQWDSDGQTLVWLEGRSGRGVLVAQEVGHNSPRDLTSEWDVRAEVGYGGGDFTVHSGQLYFVVNKLGQVYRQALAGGEAEPITPAFGNAASPAVSPNGRWVAYVHHDDEDNDRIAVVDARGRMWPQILTAGHDFYMQPRWSPDGRHLAWIAWDHPEMPWDGTLLYLAAVVDSNPPRLDKPQIIAGGKDISIFQPEFTPDGKHLLYVSDETGWGRIAVHDLERGQRRWLTADAVEYATPAWLQGMRTYAVNHDGQQVLAIRTAMGFQQLQRITLASGDASPVQALQAYTEISQISASPRGATVAIVGSTLDTTPRVVWHDFRSGQTKTTARASGETLQSSSLSACQSVSWKTAAGEVAYGLYFPPASAQFESPGKPPLIVMIHGGPTSQAKAGWRADAQFFATRGYAVLLVNYRGSTGYGRQYMLRLRGNWGVCDVEDAVSGADHLASSGQIDRQRAVIMGGSAGGFTVLQTMTTHPEAFAAGVCLYGVADQFHLAAETHKFESRYLDTLLGPLPAASQIYRDRSPVRHAEKIRRPLAIFQGEDDRVVPREQSDIIVEALKKSGTPHIYHVYQGEGHGWRKRETIEHFYKTLDDFLRRYVIFR